jgi:shikimate dehydrogenase
MPVPESAIQEIVCCMSQPVAGNPTQFMMERAFAAAGLDWRYLTLEVAPENLADAIRGLRALGFRGGNLASPHKTAAISHLDALSESAALIGAVNCVHREGEKLLGENTEGKGFVQSLRGAVDPAGKSVVILGAGVVARAIAVELGRSGVAEITIVNRTAERGQTLVALLNERVKVSARLIHLSGDYAVAENAGIVVNATPIEAGDPDARVPLDVDSLRAPMVVADVVVDPPQSQLVRDAAARGCTTLDGLGMFVNQSLISFKIWTGVDPDPEVVREALEEYLEI